ncbi:MAG: hypothetical protein QOF33_2902, partial [Thermomicrobiales bacterium]|nr:hypothetical protein [Thermomicrobiales bacterium]
MRNTVVEEFRGHDVWTRLGDLESALSRVEDLIEGIEPDVSASYVSLKAITAHARSLLEGTNPVLVPTPTLDAIKGAIDPIIGHVTTFEQNEEPSQLLLAWTNATGMLATISHLPVIKARKDTRGLAAAIAAFEQQVLDRVATVSQRTDEI